MIFKEIILKNFRQYKGEVILDFPRDNGNITLIIAQNGVGKTTLLEAFKYCFYGDIPNAMKLPKSEELLNRTALEELNEGDRDEISISIRFSFGGSDYLAKRSTEFVKVKNEAKKYKNRSNFELWKSDSENGYFSVQNPNERIQVISPIGLSHVYMFDGERFKIPVGSTEFRKDLEESITGVLGLKKLSEANRIIGDETNSTSILGGLRRKLKIQSDEEQNVIDTANLSQETININKIKITEKIKNIEKIGLEIKIAEENQAQIDELKTLQIDLKLIERDIETQKYRIDELSRNGCSKACRVVYAIELSKTYPNYIEFLSKEESHVDLYEGLHESVIKEISRRHICICGRTVEEGSLEQHYLEHLAVLPYDNAHYLTQIKNIYSIISEVQKDIDDLKEIKGALIKEKILREKMEINRENKINEIKTKEDSMDLKSLQTNIDHLKKVKMVMEQDIEKMRQENENCQRKIDSVKMKLQEIHNSDQYNKRLTEAINDMKGIKQSILEELTRKQDIARESIEKNMNSILEDVMHDDYRIKLNDNYKITVNKLTKSQEKEVVTDDTDTLSTGQTIIIYLAFLKSLLLTLEQHSEFERQENGVIMDAALSPVDEGHIKSMSNTILNRLDQLIFLSFRRGIRDELIEEIKDNVSCAYELSLNLSGNIIVKKIDTKKLVEYVNRREEN
jgi:DNA sulfur modification protein DndD